MIGKTLCQMASRTFLRSPVLRTSLIKTLPSLYNTSISMYGTSTSLDKLKFNQETVLDAQDEKKLAEEVINQVNTQIGRNEQGRLFAIVHILGKQLRVTPNDIVIVDSNSFAPMNGDQIKFEKVLLVGGSDFTLIGRPLLAPELVNVTGTIIEKDLSHTRTNFRKIPRKRHMRFRFYRTQLTMIRINDIDVKDKVGQRRDVEGVDKLIQ